MAAWYGAAYRRAKRLPDLKRELARVKPATGSITRAQAAQVRRNILLHMQMMGVDPPPEGWEAAFRAASD